MFERLRTLTVSVLGVILCLFTLVEVNYPQLQPQSTLAIFGLLGIVICFLMFPVHPKLKDNVPLRVVDLFLIAATIAYFGYVLVQTEPLFRSWWSLGQSLGNRAGQETAWDFRIGLIGLVIVLEATRRSIGLALPLLALAFVAHAYYGEELPDWLLPHAQMPFDRIVSVTCLQTLGVFGPAMNVMFTYVFLFVIFGAFLEATGGTQFIVDFAERVFAGSPGGPAKVAVLGSGLMGSLSGSAVANAVTTGAFTIPMMRNAGFPAHIAGGITAAAASGGALVPPVMGAGAYMMLEIVDPPIDSFLTIAKAALIPALLYYFSIFMIVHFYSHRTGTLAKVTDERIAHMSLLQLLSQFEGIVFFGALVSLIAFLIIGYSPFRAVTLSLAVIVFLGLIHPRKRLTLAMSFDGLVKSARSGVSLVSASACVGIIIGVVQTTGVAGEFNLAVKGLVENSLLLALLGIMACSIVLGMGVPSVVCYLLMATLMGTLLKQLGVIPLAAHLFIFYFGMMSMVTPPVALAAFASASIAGANIMRTSVAAFMFSLVGFTLPFMFIYRPELLLLSNRPDVSNLVVRGEASSSQTTISGVLERKALREPVGDAKFEIEPHSASVETTTHVTDGEGEFTLELQPGRYDIAAYNKAEERLHLGIVDFDPSRIRTVTEPDGKTRRLDERVRFIDERLSIPNVLIAVGAAGLGIFALAAGIAGYLFAPLGIVGRILAFGTAALLLYPGRGFLVGDIRIAVSDTIGLVLFLVLLGANRLVAPRESVPPVTTTQGAE